MIFQYYKKTIDDIMKAGVCLVAIPHKVIDAVQQYLIKISPDVPVRKAVLFGSFAKGTSGEDSDIELAIFSTILIGFQGWRE